MSNSKYYKNSSDEYNWTGIPCGNPKRFESRDVVKFNPHGNTCSKKRPLDGPVEDIVTEGEKHLRELVNKQLRTDINISEHLAQKKEFAHSSIVEFSAQKLTGIKSLSEFQSVESLDEYMEELRSCGLTGEEIQIKMTQKQKGQNSEGQNKLIDAESVHEIDKKIAAHYEKLSKPDVFSGKKVLSRHEMDLEKSLLQNNPKSKHLLSTLTREREFKRSVHPDDPLNHLNDILHQIVPSKRGKRNARKERQRQRLCHSSDTKAKQQCEADTEEHDETKEEEEEVVIGCHPKPIGWRSEKNSTNKQVSDEFIYIGTATAIGEDFSMTRTLQTQVDPVLEMTILRNRISVHDIRNMPPFHNYEVGEENNVLFLKNLSKQVKEEDLVSLFHRFQSSTSCPLIYRLLKGKMKGQAFVKFPDPDAAKEAFELLNGFLFKGKHIIIQYGRNKESNSS